MIGRKPDPKLGELMTELRDAYAQLSGVQALLSKTLKENEALREAIDHRACYARIEELELELADMRGIHAHRNERAEAERQRAEFAEDKMREMKERFEEIVADTLEQLGR